MAADPIPYSCQTIDKDDIAAVEAVLQSTFLTQGPQIAAFEAEFARQHDFAHAVAVCNATAALHIGCLALGVGSGDLVWTSPNSFVASANCARYCGADVDFVDIDPVDRNMSIAALTEKLEQAGRSGRMPKVVIPVDFAGLPCDVRAIRSLADKYGFRILEDASHAVGATLEGRPAGAFADIAVFSFHAVKVITTAEGGLCATQDSALAQKLSLLRSHGVTRDQNLMVRPSEGAWYYEQVELGYNYRMTDMQAALGRSQLAKLEQFQRTRQCLVDEYDRLLSSLPLILPPKKRGAVSAHHLYVVELDSSRTEKMRTEVFDRLRDDSIHVNVHYIPIHLQPYYQRLGFSEGDFPAAEAYYRQALSLPLFPRLTAAQQLRVAASLGESLR
jgi:UDP-4-amino-4,6-dideoxy-N-acetyl-beta-L-altrosamine transaminase